jgi:hypothetical protein
VGDNHDRIPRLRRFGTVIVTLAAAGLVLAACSSDKGPGPKSTTSTTVSGAPTTTKAPDTTQPPPPATTSGTVPFSISEVHTGTGPATLADFTVPSSAKEWDIDWVYYACPAPSKAGTLVISVVGHGSASKTTDAGISEPTGPGTAGIARNYDTGTFNLKVATVCKWTVRVEVLS